MVGFWDDIFPKYMRIMEEAEKNEEKLKKKKEKENDIVNAKILEKGDNENGESGADL